MNVEALLTKLNKVRKTGKGRWQACCPAHDDRTPSLTVRETDDGTILVKCWTGCGAVEVVNAVGLELKDLFPEKAPTNRKPIRPGEKWMPRDVLRAVADEARIVAVAAGTIANGGGISEDDRHRVGVAFNRLYSAAHYVGAV